MTSFPLALHRLDAAVSNECTISQVGCNIRRLLNPTAEHPILAEDLHFEDSSTHQSFSQRSFEQGPRENNSDLVQAQQEGLLQQPELRIHGRRGVLADNQGSNTKELLPIFVRIGLSEDFIVRVPPYKRAELDDTMCLLKPAVLLEVL